eukprot:371604-Pelagomonas_calceolata.AAC.1
MLPMLDRPHGGASCICHPQTQTKPLAQAMSWAPRPRDPVQEQVPPNLIPPFFFVTRAEGHNNVPQGPLLKRELLKRKTERQAQKHKDRKRGRGSRGSSKLLQTKLKEKQGQGNILPHENGSISDSMFNPEDMDKDPPQHI